jgi:hypothetical protein
LNNKIFETEPPALFMASTAWDEWLRFSAGNTDQGALKRLYEIHLNHVRDTLAQGGIEDGDGAIFVTEIPDFDLAVVDGHFPHLKERRASLFSKDAAEKIVNVLIQSLNPGTVH